MEFADYLHGSGVDGVGVAAGARGGIGWMAGNIGTLAVGIGLLRACIDPLAAGIGLLETTIGIERLFTSAKGFVGGASLV